MRAIDGVSPIYVCADCEAIGGVGAEDVSLVCGAVCSEYIVRIEVVGV